MFILRGSLAVGLALALTAAVSAAPNRSVTARGRNNSRYAIQGIVVRVHHDRSPRGAGWIQVRRSHHHRYGRGRTTAAAAVGRNRARGGGQGAKFAVNSSTHFKRQAQGRNRGARAMRVSFQAVRTGEHVRVFPGSGQRRAAREVVILSNQSHRSAHRRHLSNRSLHGRRNGAYARHTLIGSRVLARHGHRQHVLTKRPVRTVSTVRRPVQHTLINGRVSRQVQQKHHPVVATKTVKHVVQNQKKPTPKRTTTAKSATKKQKPAPKHSPAPKPSSKRKH